MCLCVCVCVWGGEGAVCVWRGGEVLETKLFLGGGSAAKGGLTEKVGIPYL